jgi:hypothetical protein
VLCAISAAAAILLIFIITLILASPTMLKRCCRHHAIPKWQGRSIRKHLKRGAAAVAAAVAAAAQISTEQAPLDAGSDNALDHFDGDHALRFMEFDHFDGDDDDWFVTDF